MAVSLTEAAARHVAGQLDSRGSGIGIRLGVTTSGCSGMAYVLEFVDEGQPEDQVVKDTDRDFWMSAEEAREYGLISKIVNKTDELNGG